MTRPRWHMGEQGAGALCGLGAAASFGLAAPLSKLLLGHVSPLLLAGLLYAGAALGLWLQRALGFARAEAPLRRADVPTLALVVVSGGVLGPVLLLLGLSRLSALSGSLLLNLEAPFTILLSVAAFGEHLGTRAAWSAACIVLGAAVLQLRPGPLSADGWGVLLVAAACACWALDNNLTQRLSLKDPFAIVRVKTLAAGAVNTVLGLLVAPGGWPPATYVLGAFALGSVSYGASVVLDTYALRRLGAAREAAYFATAPFVGALAAVWLLHDPVRAYDALAMIAMVAGVVLLLNERHRHRHAHVPLVHEHVHYHDAHHRHAHGPEDPPGEPHVHVHQHARLVHDHPHVPDEHHRHSH